MGLRLIKLTVNYDDPETYHLYFGDELGHPGTILTFFPWPGAVKGSKGTGQATATSFSISRESLGYWADRLRERGVRFEGPADRFGDQVISFSDPDGLELELIGTAGAEGRRGGWDWAGTAGTLDPEPVRGHPLRGGLREDRIPAGRDDGFSARQAGWEPVQIRGGRGRPWRDGRHLLLSARGADRLRERGYRAPRRMAPPPPTRRRESGGGSWSRPG